jgi:hypothetical protein
MKKLIACAALAAATAFTFVTPSADAAKCPRGKNYTYIANSTEECATIRFICTEGTPFFNECGCGCFTGGN